MRAARLPPLCAGLLLALVSVAGAGDVPPGLCPSLGGGRVVTGAIAHRIIHFTFDDGPDPEQTPRLLDAMDALGVKATFFLSASRFRPGQRRNAEAPRLARELLERGHVVGSHSVDHVRMGAMEPAELRAQLDEGQRLFERVVGARTYLFRPPFGSRNRALDRMLHARGYTTVMWNLGLADWVERPPEAIARTFDKMLARAAEEGQRGGIVLLHDTHHWSVDGFLLIVKRIQASNCAQLAAESTGAPRAELFEIADDPRPFVVPVADAGPGVDGPLVELSPEVLAARQDALRVRERARCAAAEKDPPR